MKLSGWVGMLAGCWALAASAQQPIQTPILMGAEASPLGDQLQDDRIDHRPLAQEDRTLKVGRELKQGEAVVKIAPPPPQSDSSGSRVRARALLAEDRERVKQAAALAD
jgi:hypothetical protein